MNIDYTIPIIKEECSFTYTVGKEDRQSGYDILIPMGYHYSGEYSTTDPEGNTRTTVKMIREITFSNYLSNIYQGA